MKSLCAAIGKYFGIIAIVFLILGLTTPDYWKWVVGKVGGVSVLACMLGIVMFGMGTTLNLKDFGLILKRPFDVFLGSIAQYFVMPFLAYLLAVFFNLDPALTVGVVLVGTCPGGTSFFQCDHFYEQRRCSFIRSYDDGIYTSLSYFNSYDYLSVDWPAY